MGKTGSYMVGKGDLIRNCTGFRDIKTGNGHSSVTPRPITQYSKRIPGRKGLFTDTPGFTDITTEVEVFTSLAQWLYEIMPGTSDPKALLFSNPIDDRFQSIRVLELLKCICGPASTPTLRRNHLQTWPLATVAEAARAAVPGSAFPYYG